MPEHLSRRELKTDNVAIAVENTAEYVAGHRSLFIRGGIAIVVVILVGVAVYFWMERAREERQEKLAQAQLISAATIGPSQTPGALTYPTQEAKDAAVSKAYSEVAAQYGNSDEGAVANYTLAGMAAGAGKNDEARRRYQNVIDSASKNYASLAKLALGDLDFAENRAADGEKLFRDLMDHPTILVSKDQATFSLARQLAKTRPAEARKLLEPLRSASGPVGQLASVAYTDIPVTK